MNMLLITQTVTLMANVLAEGLTDEELELLAAVLTQLGDTITTILTCKR